MTKSFSIRRFRHLLACEIMGSRQALLQTFVVLFGLFFLILGYCVWGTRTDRAEDSMDAYEFGVVLCSFVLSCAAAYFCSMVFRPLRKKEQAVRFLVLPASMLEKYLVRLVYVCVVLYLVAWVALLVADGMATLLATLFHRPYMMEAMRETYFSDTLSVTTSTVEGPYEFPYYLSKFIVWFYGAYFILCATVFRQSLVACVVAFFISLVPAVLAIRQLNVSTFTSATLDTACTVISLLLLALIFLCLWLAYKVFCRRQIVTHEWINL